MKNIKINDIVKILKDKDFICPAEHVKKGSLGRVCEIIKQDDSVGYLVEIDYDIFDFEEDEIEVLKHG